MTARHPSSARADWPNPTCRYLGHEWQVDFSGTLRSCVRHKCHATERLTNGRWRQVVHPAASRTHPTSDPGAAVAEHPLFSDEATDAPPKGGTSHA